MNAYKRYANKLKTTKEMITPNVKMSSEGDEIEKFQILKSKDPKEIEEENNNNNDDNNNVNNQEIYQNPILNLSKVDTNYLSIDNANTSTTKKDYLKKFDFNIFKTKIYDQQIAERHFVISEEMINLDEYDEEGRNVLHRAAFQQKLSIVKSITKTITKSEIIDKKDMYGNTALLLACKNFNFQKDIAIRIEIIKTLLNRKADVNTCEPINLWTPLHWLAFNGDENSLSLLIKKGAVYFLPDREGYFPIDLAGRKNYTKIVELIIQEFLHFMDTVGEFVVLDPNVLGSKRVKSLNLLGKISHADREKSDEGEFNELNKGANSETNFLKILNSKKKNSLQNNFPLSDKHNTAEDIDNTEHDEKEKSFASEYSQSLNSKNDSENDDDEAEKKICTDLHLVDPILQTILIKVFSHHCLYWASYYKINTMYVNKLITLYNADPSFKLFSARLQTPIHGACLNGNLMAFKLLLNKFNDNKIERKIKIQKDLAIFGVKKSKSIMQDKFNFIKNIALSGVKTQEQIQLKNYRKLVKKDLRFKMFSKKFKKYMLDLVKKVFHLEVKTKLKKLLKEKEIINLQDKNRNTPLHLAASNGKHNFIKNLLETDLLERPLDQFFNQINREGFSGYALLKEENLINRILVKSGKALYNVPLVVLELLKNDHSKLAVNLIMKLALTEKLKVVLMEHQDKSKVYICLDITDDIFKVQAEKEKLKVKMLHQNLKKTFENNEDFIASAEPFFSRQKQDVILKMMSNVLDLKQLKDQKILLKIFYTHKPNVTDRIKKLWLDHPWYFPNPFRMFMKMISEGKEICYDEINILYRYFGEKQALYYAFISFFLNFLTYIALVGVGFALYYRENIITSNTMFPIYSIIFLFWQIVFIEAWKRKNSEITHKWGVNEIYNQRELRPNFKGDEYYKDLNGKLEKHQTNTKKIILFLLSLPIIIGLLAAVIIIFYYATQFQDKYANTKILKYVPAIAKSLSIIIINLVYDNVARLFTDLENHKYQEVYENAIIAKIFSFNIVSNLTAVIYTTIKSQGAEDLKSLLYTLIVTKLIMDPISNVLVPYLKIKLFTQHYFSKVRDSAMEYSEAKEMEKDNNVEIMRMMSYASVGVNSSEYIKKNSESSNRLNRDEEKLKQFADVLKEKYEKKNKRKISRLARNNDNHNQIEASPFEAPHTFNIKYFRKVKIINGDEEIFYSAQDINPDFIELNNLMPERLEIVYYYANICLLLTVSSLFSIVIPLAPVLIIIFTTISQYFKIYADIYIFKRPRAERAINIGLWLEIIDVVSTVSITFNAFLFYYYNANEFNVYTRYITKAVLPATSSSEFSVGQGETALLVIALGEHVIILLKYFLRYFIPDVPVWVSKERDLLLSILEDSNKEKEELHNQAVDNVISQQLKIFNTTIDGKNKEIIKMKENLNKNFDVLKIYKEELERTNSKINQVEFINKVLSEKNEKLENIRKEYTNYLNDKPEKIKSNFKAGIFSSQNVDDLQALQVNKILSNLDKNTNSNPSSNDKNSVKQIPQRKFGKKDFEETIDFKFDKTMEKITRDILRGRQIVLQDEMSEMRKNINKLYILNLLKNTFDRIEKEILVKKFEKCIQLIDKPIVLCNQCSANIIKYYCIDCEEKLCQSCKEVHLSNVLWEKHKCQAIIDELELNASANAAKDKDKKEFHNKLVLNEDRYGDNLNPQVKKEEESAMYKNMFRRRTIRATIKGSGDGHRNTLMQKLRKKGILQNKKLFAGNNLDSNHISNNKPRNVLPNNTNPLLKSPEPINIGLFQKMESFCFPVSLYNLNFENLTTYFAYIKREYIDLNGINSDSTVDTKRFIENKIDYSARFYENPNSVLQDDFTNILSNSIFNFEEQFLINRIAFHKFKEYGAKLEVSNVLEILKILQESTYEEKLKVILNVIDIHGNKLILKSELQKLLVFMVVQNEEKNYRIGAIIEEIFGKKNVIEYDKLYHICLDNLVERELFCEILQINE